MSVYIDRKFLGFVSPKLELFKQKNTDLYNFRCIFCGDSQKNKLKARGYIYRKNNDYFYRCHNCNKSTTFSKFLQEIDTSLYNQYALERYSKGETSHHNYQKPKFEEFKGIAAKHFACNAEESKNKTWDKINLPNVRSLPEEHYARAYIENRKIPEQFWEEIFYTDNFKKFLDEEFPNHGKKDLPSDDRIVLFYTNEKGEVTNVAGRALSESKIRYITVKITDEKKIFGLHRLRKKDKVYALEGQFDSFFIPNSIASGDSNLGSMAAIFPELDLTLVYDAEPRNKEITKQIEKSIDNGYKVCLFPESVPGKDINEMVINGIKIDELIDIINTHTYCGLAAKLEFTKWKKC